MALSSGEKKRQLIKGAVLRIIDAQGVSAVTHRSVAAQAGLSSGLVSYHFPTRDELIFKAFETYLGSIDDYANAIGLSDDEVIPKGDTKAYLIDVFSRIVRAELEDNSYGSLDFELSLYGTRNREIAKLFNDWTQAGVASIARKLDSLGVPDAANITAALISLVRGFLLECLTNPELTEADFRQRAQAALGAFVNDSKFTSGML